MNGIIIQLLVIIIIYSNNNVQQILLQSKLLELQQAFNEYSSDNNSTKSNKIKQSFQNILQISQKLNKKTDIMWTRI